eukprot:TRINITY_DN11229_c0_g1_i1.p1 TRINITY_DN11229_c0_g1~~TRINITY_DN11229_c0_g1_i1.p1  ORF type:complete len:426 (+),score=63.60 TRINITY_DN11229_c0_g1_i1:662-1939(+)
MMRETLIGPTTYDKEPARDPSLVINGKTPFNAETHSRDLAKSFITPTELFYKRNHGPIPICDDVEGYRVKIEGLLPKPLELSLQDIKNLPKHSVVVTLQCAGNRRTEMSLKRKVKGVGWGLAALGNAVWSGAHLADVLALAGVPVRSVKTATGGRHVEFISVDKCPEEKGGPYKGSLPLLQASSPEMDVLLAYEMNGQPLNRDHGFPLRVVAPGVIGARSVKWLDSINLRADECQGFFVQRDYKTFPPWIDWHNVDWGSRRPIMDFPVQSAICQPVDGDVFPPGTLTTIRGYAIAGLGRGIERVDVSPDGGATWQEATRLPPTDPFLSEMNVFDKARSVTAYVADLDINDEEGSAGGRDKWAWVLWEATLRLETPCQVVVKAVDSSSSSQPENVDHIWNLRGVLNNSWHRITVNAPVTGQTKSNL